MFSFLRFTAPRSSSSAIQLVQQLNLVRLLTSGFLIYILLKILKFSSVLSISKIFIENRLRACLLAGFGSSGANNLAMTLARFLRFVRGVQGERLVAVHLGVPY
jgi:hypothetical protein